MLTYILGHLWSLGGAVAVVTSYSEYKDARWAAFHGLFGWGYPLYKWVMR